MTLRCSFCGCSQHTEHLIAGPQVFICESCVEDCRAVLAEGPGARWLREIGEAEYASWGARTI